MEMITAQPRTPRKAIVLFCKECVSGNLELCASPNCLFYPFKRHKTLSGAPKSILKTIKQYCLDCTGGQYNETKNCTGRDCPVYPFRLGRNQYLNGRGCSREHMLKINTATRFKASATVEE